METQTQYPCQACGANVEFAPGTTSLRCPYCGNQTAIPESAQVIREHSYEEFETLGRKPISQLGAHVYTCQGCGARTESNSISERCQFCGAPLVAEVDAAEQVVPEAVVPFSVTREALREALQKWVASRWFAPGGLKKVTAAESSHSTYLPHWTFDADTVSSYTGMRGVHYYVSETYTDGEGRTQTRQVQRTQWYPASGRVSRDFDDVLVTATDRVSPKHLAELDPWPLESAVPYQAAYLAGHETLRYEVDPPQGLERAKGEMSAVIQEDCRQDIGGDVQQVTSVDTSYAEITFKLMLLPVWIACYLYAGKTYNVLVNGRTGEVAGERPYSVPKIIAAIAAAIVVIALGVWLYVHYHNS